MRFAFPIAFALLIIPILMRLYLKPVHVNSAWMALPDAIERAGQPATKARAQNTKGFLLWYVAWALLVFALAGPQQLREAPSFPSSGRDIFLALDMSGSMEKQDFSLDGVELSRLDAVKKVASSFVQSRRGDRVGLTLFGDRAYIASPLTHDLQTVATTINQAQIGVSGKSTAISDGLGLSMKRLRESDAQSRVVILLSDGVDTTGKVDPEGAASYAKSLGIRVHTIALGPEDLESNPGAKDAVDADTLALIAEKSGGERFRVRNMNELKAVADEIDALEPTPIDTPPIAYWQDLWQWPASAGFVLLTLAAWRDGRRA